ncbi:MAG: class I SAM-dependent methyltransferase, partial [Spirochaetales bacterium]|nr:class I SAM-dependent methyltransferase [Spirochaetales bacterium]
RALTDNVNLDGKSILDVGCGCGDLYDLIKTDYKINSRYLGVYILEKMVKRAESEHEEASFFLADIFDDSFFAEDAFGCCNFDITFTSGIFNLQAGNNEDFLKKAIPILASLSTEAFVFNLLNPESPDPDNRYFYYAPEKAAELAEPFSKKIELIDGYLDNDYTLICWR